MQLLGPAEPAELIALKTASSFSSSGLGIIGGSPSAQASALSFSDDQRLAERGTRAGHGWAARKY